MNLPKFQPNSQRRIKMSFPYLHETKELNDETRKEAASGAFVRLTDGICHYELYAPPLLEEGLEMGFGIVVLIHGFSVPYFIWNPTFDFLVKSGFRVLRYDLFGRGLSDRPHTDYNIHLFVRQLKDLLDALEIAEPVHLVGLSMGGAISAAFVDQYSERVKSHILVDPAGAKPIPLSWTLKAARLPLVAELVLGLFGGETLVKGLASDFFSPDLIEQFQANYRFQMRYQGFIRAILSSIRNGMLDSFYETYQRVGKLNKPTLLFWGCNDTTVPFANSRVILSAIPHAEFHPIEDCSHIPHYERPDELNPILSEFIIQNS
jgi:pimeloyl-ACP methyl ester carboxylesterase